MEYRYKAIQMQQTSSAKLLTIFSAPATEIDTWAGIPQKKRFGTGEETAGFQREENTKRIKSLRDFYLDGENIIQNPLLCSMRKINLSSVHFAPSHDQPVNDVVNGDIVIKLPELSSLSFREIMDRVRQYIENRVQSLMDASRI